jgi:hypothetical protein
MIREWLLPTGNIKVYDTVTQTVQVVDQSRLIVEAVRPRNQDDLAEYLANFPSAPAEEITAISVMSGQLMAALEALRVATEDGSVTPTEFATANTPVQVALRNYSAFNYRSDTVDKLAFLVLTQVSYAYSMLLASGARSTGIQANAVLNLNVRAQGLDDRMDALEARILALEP